MSDLKNSKLGVVLLILETYYFFLANKGNVVVRFELFDLEVKGQGPTKVIVVHDTPPYGHAPTYQISLTYLERQTSYGPVKRVIFLTGCIQCKQSLSRRSLELRGDFSNAQMIIYLRRH
jgi:hypothetical protein